MRNFWHRAPGARHAALPPALEPHGVWAAANPADAALYWRDLLGTHRASIASADAGRFEATLHGVLVRDVTLGYLDYSMAVRIEVRSRSTSAGCSARRSPTHRQRARP